MRRTTRRRGVPVSGTVQSLSDPRGRAPVESPASCGTECLARELGGVGGGVAVVQLRTAKGITGGFPHPSPCPLPVGERVQRTVIPFAVLMASAQGRPFGRAGRGAGALAGGLATAGAVRGDGSRAGRLRRSVVRGVPFGEACWQDQTAQRLHLESTLRATRSAAEGSARLDQRDLRLPTPFAGPPIRTSPSPLRSSFAASFHEGWHDGSNSSRGPPDAEHRPDELSVFQSPFGAMRKTPGRLLAPPQMVK